jgi:hypothetical protein
MGARWLLTMGAAALAWPVLAAEPTSLQPPVKLMAAGKVIDVDIGHAAPFVADLNGDGVLHLLVGQFGEGKLRIYRNEGTRSEPRFGKVAWFRNGAANSTVPSG